MNPIAQARAEDAMNGMNGRAHGLTASLCAYRTATVDEVAHKAASGEWNIPAFQRGFIWKTWQICDILDSLWRDYPIGPLLLWRNYNRDDPEVRFWIADGQHRIAALCIAFGLTPAWWRQGRKPPRPGSVVRCDVVFDAEASTPPFFLAASGEPLKRASLVPVQKLLRLDLNTEYGRYELESLVEHLRAGGCALASDDLYDRLARVCRIREQSVALVDLAHLEEEDVLEVFRRQNTRGIRFRRFLLRLIASCFARTSFR